MNKLIVCILFCMAAYSAACDKSDDPSHIATTGITLDVKSLALKIGDTHALTATITPENASNHNLVWTSNNEAIATIDPATGIVTGCGLGQTTIRVTPVTDCSLQAYCTITVLATDPYTVGDLYPDTTTPQGMVFWIDPENPIKGKIVSLNQTQTMWARNNTVTSAVDSNDGQANMSIIAALEEWQENYPAFAWCAAKGEGWYLPALGELLSLYQVRELLEQIILQNGDTPFTTGDYWSSTERRQNPASTAVTVMFRHVSDNESWASKDGQCAVRAIKAF